MNKNYIPSFYQKEIFKLDVLKLAQMGYEVVLCDLDNTLANPYVVKPDLKVKNFIQKFKDLKIEFIVISNNRLKRVETFCKELDVLYLNSCRKPHTKKIKEFLKYHQLDDKKCLCLGDQIMTDVSMANRLHVDVILLDPLTKQDQLITFFPRLLDQYYRKKLLKKNLLREF